MFVHPHRTSPIHVCLSRFAFVVGVCLTTLPSASAEKWQDAAVGSENEVVTIPLNDGKVSLGWLADTLLEEVGVNVAGLADQSEPQIEVNKPAGRLTLMLITRATQRAVTFDVNDRELVVRLDEARLRSEEKRVRSALRLLVQRRFPGLAAQAEATYGIRVHAGDGTTVIPNSATVRPEVVVLVHGLDDPGKVWNVLVPALVRESLIVCEFRYPNDQPISRSADLLCKELEQLRALDVRRVTLIAHSMGGLVSREVLTSPHSYAGRGSGHAAWPDVTRLIMVATPNHGSAMVKLRFVGELREQIERGVSGEGGVLTAVLDGAGEAKVDLLPGSEFLESLNARELPTDVFLTIIAGRSSPITEGTVNWLRSALELIRPESVRDKLDHLVGEFSQFTDGVSDGLVTVESTRLTGVDDHVIVDGNHMTVIRNLTKTSQRVPPAIPHILDRVGRNPGSNR